MPTRKLILLFLSILTLNLLLSCHGATPTLVFATPTPPTPSPAASKTIPTAFVPPDSPTPPPAATQTPAPSPAPPYTTAPTPLPRGGSIVEAGQFEISTLNPLLAAADDELARAVGGLLFDSLLHVNAQTAALMPGLARDWKVSEDGRVFTFHLRPDAAWHDGKAFSAADVTLTLALAGDPEGPSPYRFDLARIIEVKAPDSATIVVTVDEPGCDTLYAVGRVPILPRHLLEGQALDEAASFNRHPVGTGPFAFDAWNSDGSLALTANQNYWAGRPRLDSWTYRVAQDLKGAHLARLPNDAETESLPEGWRSISYPAENWHFLALNNDHPILSDPAVRRALAMALDRKRLLEAVLDAQGTLMDSPWLAEHWAVEGASLAPLPYDPDQARRLLADAGWRDTDGDGLLEKDGTGLNLSLSANAGNTAREQIAVLVQQYWHAIGVSAQVEVLPWGVFLDDLFNHTFDVAVFDWPLEPGPDQTWLWAAGENEPGSGFNFCSYASAEADALLEQGRAAHACDPARRAAAYRDLAQHLAADQPYIFLFAAHRQLGVSQNLLGPQPGAYAGLYWNIAEWHLTDSNRQ